MLETRVIPVLLLKDNGLVKTEKFKKYRYVGDPINAIRIFNEKEVDELILLDLEANNSGKINFNLIERITSECFMPLCYGGGIQDIDTIRKILALGVEKIALNTFALNNLSFLKSAIEEFGSSTIVLSIDIKKNILGKYEIYTNGGKKKHSRSLEEVLISIEQLKVGEVLINSIDKDGTQSGYDLKLIKKVSELITMPVVACGGAGSIEDFKLGKENGASALAAGSFFVFHGKFKAVLITYPERNKLKF